MWYADVGCVSIHGITLGQSTVFKQSNLLNLSHEEDTCGAVHNSGSFIQVQQHIRSGLIQEMGESI